MTNAQKDLVYGRTALREAKLKLAEKISGYFDRNIQLTMQMLIQPASDVTSQLLERAENSERIAALIEEIRKQAESENEKKLLEAASARWSATHILAPSLHHFIGKQKNIENGSGIADVLLPLLLDSASWEAFVQLLHAQMESDVDTESNCQLANRTGAFVRATQQLKSALAERKRIAEKLSQLTSIIECSNDAIVIYSLDGVIVSWNVGAESVYGYSRSEVLGKPRHVLLPQGQDDELPGMLGMLKRGEKIELYETVHCRKDSQRIDVSMMISPVKDASEKVVGAAAITRDITERKSLEAQLRQAQKMECIGRLSGGIAHDFNNLLNVIIGYSDILEGEINGNAELRKGVHEIKKAGQRAAGFTRQLLAFSRQQVLEPKVLSLNTVVSDIGKMLLRLIGEDIELITTLAAIQGRVKADQGQIEQVIMNLVVNARDAMPHGGKLIIETTDLFLDDAYARQHSTVAPGQYVMLSVTDNGVGMNKETQDHIFEPFFTTKEQDKGTGLGLSVVYGVVNQSGGHIDVASELGKGTTFKIYLPLAQEAVEKQTRSTIAASSLKGSETILLVEDEASLRDLIRRLLTQSGYTVLDTGSGPQALEIAREHQQSIHLLLTDVVLPGISGTVLPGEIVKQRPGVKVLFMSGYTANHVAAQHVLEAGTFLLEKPFEADALRHKVREALNATV